MLRIHFTEEDLNRTRMASRPDPLWEVTSSLHRLQSRQGRRAFADWHHTTRSRLQKRNMVPTLRSALLPIFPKAAYLPDFLTPSASAEGLEAGLDAILSAPHARVLREVSLMRRVTRTPTWAPELAGTDRRRQLVQAIRAYHDAAVAPHAERIHALVDAERAAHARRLLDGGVDGALSGISPTMAWRRPVLHVHYPAEDRDLHLDGRGLLLIPSYFTWRSPISLADPALPPVLVYPLVRDQPVTAEAKDRPPHERGSPLSALLGQTRTVILRASATGSTTGELARAAEVSLSAVSRHTAALRNAGLVTTVRQGKAVLHTLTPLGAALLQGKPPRNISPADRASDAPPCSACRESRS
ncbi:winged helix-turn-helix domain-containing protein [Streptomyces sp. WAC00276]|nr:winged helix-turn-helix domain-containing protein [Streptomyces sp. WAC00276]